MVGAQPSPGGDGYELNFENTPVTGVAKVVLGDILQVGYLIDPRVQGTITLASGRPVPKGDLLYVLESALRISGAALVKDKRGYVILPANGETLDFDEAEFRPGKQPARAVPSGALMGIYEWARSLESGRLVPASEPWTNWPGATAGAVVAA